MVRFLSVKLKFKRFFILSFDSILSADDVVNFFKENFPDALDLIGKSRLIESYFAIQPSPLISIKVVNSFWGILFF